MNNNLFTFNDEYPDDLDELDHFYEYDPETGDMLGETWFALTEGMKIPINHTATAPAAYNKDTKTANYDIKNDKWNIILLDEPLKAVKDFAKNSIDAEIKSVLRRNVTISVQNAGLYTLKYDEAVKYLAAGEPTDLDDYPFLSVEASIRGTSPGAVAEVIVTKHDEWNTTLKNLEIIRLQAKTDISALEITSSSDEAKIRIEKIVDTAIAELSNL